MKQKFIVILTMFTLIGLSSKAQEFEVPKNYQFNNASDYATYEKDIISCAKWLEETPLNEQEQKRIDANAFLMKWLTGSPTVSINMDAEIVTKCTDKNPQLLMLFLAGWTKYSLENSYSKDIHKGYYAGFISMINVYNKGISIKKDKDMLKMIDIYDKGELEKWISENIKTN